MRRAVMLLWPVAISLAARADEARDALDRKVQAIVAEPGDAVQAGIWFGAPAAPIYELAATRTMPAASVVKTAILIELYAAHAGHLDDPLGAAADAVLADDKHPAMAPFSAAGRGEIRAAFQAATARGLGAILMGSKKASNAVYNGAANLAIALLGGPADASAKIHARDAAFAGVMVRRYMLASRTVHGDNEATPASLAAVLAAVATGKVAGVDADTTAAMAQSMMQATDPALGVHRHKEGNLDNDPMTCVKTGFYVRGAGRPPLVYVVGTALPAKPSGHRADAARRLDRMTEDILAVLRAAGGR